MFHNYCLAPHFSDPSLFHLNWDNVSKQELLRSRQSYFLNALCTFPLILVTWKDLLRRSHQFKGRSFRDLKLFYSHYSTITSLVQVFLSISFSLISSTNTKRPLPSSSTKHIEKMLSCHFTGTFLETRKISVKTAVAVVCRKWGMLRMQHAWVYSINRMPAIAFVGSTNFKQQTKHF